MDFIKKNACPLAIFSTIHIHLRNSEVTVNRIQLKHTAGSYHHKNGTNFAALGYHDV